MLTVKTKLRLSPIHGIGLFAAERIPRGTVIWQLAPDLDLRLEEALVRGLPEPARATLHHYCYLEDDGKFTLCFDDTRFMNHAEDPNTVEGDDGLTRAARDIEDGEELTTDYRVYDTLSRPIPFPEDEL